MIIKINNTKFNVKVLTTPEERSEGMMFKTFSNDKNGMLFIMNENGKQDFWMKNCLVPLDMIFISFNEITKIHHNCKPCTKDCPTYSGNGNIVLEVKGGTCKKENIKIGDQVTFLKS